GAGSFVRGLVLGLGGSAALSLGSRRILSRKGRAFLAALLRQQGLAALRSGGFRRCRLFFLRRAFIGTEITEPGFFECLELNDPLALDKFDLGKGQAVPLGFPARRPGQRGSQLLVIERRRACPVLYFHHDEFLALAKIVAVPEPRVVPEPMRRDPRLVDP